MDIKSHLVWQCERLWSDELESFEYAVRGVTEEEAAWQAPAYADVERQDGWPPPGTVFWHVAHLGEYQRQLAGHLRQESPPAGSYRPAARFADELARVHDARRMVASALAELPDERFAGEDVVRRIQEYFLHDVWHTAQILVARRLYAHARGQLSW
jgi:hypothetical protein